VSDETTPEPEPAKTRLDLLADVVRAQLGIVATLQDLSPKQRLRVIRWINDNHETLIDLDSANNQQRAEHAGDDDEL
jgi:flagellar biosynthesis component FlhA